MVRLNALSAIVPGHVIETDETIACEAAFLRWRSAPDVVTAGGE